MIAHGSRFRADPAVQDTLEFVAALWNVHHALEAASTAMEARIGITAPQRLILRFIGRYPGVTSGRLSSLLGVHPATVSGSLRRLEARGLVTRTRDPRDRRRVTLGLTAAGRKYDQPVDGTVEQSVSKVLATLPSAQIETARDVLTAVAAKLGSERKSRLPPAL